MSLLCLMRGKINEDSSHASSLTISIKNLCTILIFYEYIYHLGVTLNDDIIDDGHVVQCEKCFSLMRSQIKFWKSHKMWGHYLHPIRIYCRKFNFVCGWMGVNFTHSCARIGLIRMIHLLLKKLEQIKQKNGLLIKNGVLL